LASKARRASSSAYPFCEYSSPLLSLTGGSISWIDWVQLWSRPQQRGLGHQYPARRRTGPDRKAVQDGPLPDTLPDKRRRHRKLSRAACWLVWLPPTMCHFRVLSAAGTMLRPLSLWLSFQAAAFFQVSAFYRLAPTSSASLIPKHSADYWLVLQHCLKARRSHRSCTTLRRNRSQNTRSASSFPSCSSCPTRTSSPMRRSPRQGRSVRRCVCVFLGGRSVFNVECHTSAGYATVHS
jgi:hypothetical protein